MENQANENVLNKKVWLNSLKIFAITLGALIFIFFFVISSMFFISPKFDAKIFNFFGLEKAEEACYVEAYEKSGSNVDLYNLIIFESELENYEKELMYINELMNDEDYVEFYQKLDKSAINAVEDKSLIAYACNTNGYLINQKLKCMYALGFSEININNFVKTQIESEFLFDNTFIVYVELIKNDESLTVEQKQQKLEAVYNMVDTSLSNRLLKLKTYVDSDVSLANKIIAQNAIVNIKKADYLIDVINESEDSESSKASYENALLVYNNMIK